ncbi:MAG: aldo/keto reductase [Myxococcota bacterium]
MSAQPLILGTARLSELDRPEAERLLSEAVELGVFAIDTARSYGQAEEWIGRWLAGRSGQDVRLSTKVGYGVEGYPDWTAETVRRGVDDALRRLCTDRLEYVFLHSCGSEVWEREDVIGALEAARSAGKLVHVGYAGDGPALRAAVETGRFDAYQSSFNLFDRRSRDDLHAVPGTRLAKRALGNAPWRHAHAPGDPAESELFERFRAIGLEASGAWAEFALRFAVFHSGFDAAIVGTRSHQRLRDHVAALEQGPLNDATLAEIERAYAAVGSDWDGIV